MQGKCKVFAGVVLALGLAGCGNEPASHSVAWYEAHYKAAEATGDWCTKHKDHENDANCQAAFNAQIAHDMFGSPTAQQKPAVVTKGGTLNRLAAVLTGKN